MKQSIYRLFIELTNKKWSSFLIRKFVQSPLSRPVISSFIKTYKINVDEIAGDVSDYKTLHDFFIRNLKEDARVIQHSDEQAVSPVDGLMASSGIITDDLLIEVKGKTYSILDMLGSEGKASSYSGGEFAVFYLSPANYHRIHSPVSGTVLSRWSLGDHSYPVNELGLKYGKEALSKNFRSITELQTKGGKVAVVKVGAMFVNCVDYVHENKEWKQGEEVAYFSFGSTVILLFEKNSFAFQEERTVPRNVTVGETIGDFIR
ncbi:phosphatidylserine decarboxylase [Bacillus sp. KH172YL63]|uniref:phosphatidylserine decarboxylase n=1 Tax=Bacillus sp. KH172YL63 TaxID=2709784 RepID=UPI0013E485C6|nr:phosphatidylserine decarboxylase [Bacillus sp. KH172YL63]BCB04908.1 phosphatidylserine decarboxylase proenzyme [Bacillus sp. KH172YL63]